MGHYHKYLFHMTWNMWVNNGVVSLILVSDCVKTAQFTQVFPSGMMPHSKIAQFNGECIGCLTLPLHQNVKHLPQVLHHLVCFKGPVTKQHSVSKG